MILIIDFGSQYTSLIWKGLNQMGYESEIWGHLEYELKVKDWKQVEGIILSGSPWSIYEIGAPDFENELLGLGVPILGICYGMNLVVQKLGGEVVKGEKGDYGRAHLVIKKRDQLLEGVEDGSMIWMSHGDEVKSLSEGLEVLGVTEEGGEYAVIKSGEVYGLQFHPEVHESEYGEQILSNFAFKVCGVKGKKQRGWGDLIEERKEWIKKKVRDEGVICGVSGGVDSLVAAILIHKAIGGNLRCVFVDHGLSRKDEGERIFKILKQRYGIGLEVIEAGGIFFERLKGVTSGEEKRKVIGREFIEVFERRAKREGIKYLGQGTIYSDVIESGVGKGSSRVLIKSHHNVEGLPEGMGFELIEPLKELFKDEVRELGKELGVSEELLNREPFPGPGFGIRVIGEVTEDRVRRLRIADEILREELEGLEFDQKIWQGFTVLLPLKTVGVKGDQRTEGEVISIRVVQSRDGMTGDWAFIPHEILGKVSKRITNEVTGISRVVYDITSKPPGTIEWE